jgi:DNA-binding NtrC family response regulator
MSTQVKLLRVLEEKEIERVGEHKPIDVNVRVVSATNKRLEKLIETGAFREDLFFRINVFPIRCPALRERKEDIPAIVQRFIKTNAAKTGKRIPGLTPGAMEKLARFDWPGNVRELRNAIEYAFVLCSSGEIDIRHLPPVIAQGSSECSPPEWTPDRNQQEKAELLKVLRKTGGNQSETGRLLGVSRVTIRKRIKKHGIEVLREIRG